jgi:hypothetical protein
LPNDYSPTSTAAEAVLELKGGPYANIALTPAAVSAIINRPRRARLTVWQRI